MKKYLAILAMFSMFWGVMPVSAQDQAPPPQGQSDQGYGQYDQQPGQGPNQSAYQNFNQGTTQSADAPGVARLSLMQGDVSSQRGDNGDWVAETVNSPIAVGDRVSTGQGGRAEIQLDYANVLRLSDNATAKIANLTRGTIQVQVGRGLVTYSVLNGAEANAEVDTPNVAVHPSGPGEYRILVNSDSETEITIRSGSADVTVPQGSTHVDSGEMITIQGTDDPQYRTSAAPARDDWDTWNDQRDQRIANASSWGKTDRYYTGTEDLDKNGTWSEVPDYGPVWTPREGPGWTPYSNGRWVYQPYYGWTWVGYEPWGWAPYHYGRWFVTGGNWAWWPGPVVGYPGYYPVWSPAYVSFFGWGGGGFGIGFGFGFGFGHVGWLPCGPGDWYHPWWGRGASFSTVNVTNIHNTTIVNRNGFGPLGPRGEHSFSNVNEAFRNDRVRAGITSMDSSRFGRESVSGNSRGLSEGEFRQASLVSGKMPITPSRESFSPSGRNANPSSFRNAPASSQHFFTGGARNGNTLAGGQASHSFGNSNQGSQGQSGFGNNRGNQSFDRQAPRSTSQAMNDNRGNNTGAVQTSRPGWHSFTPPQSNGGNRSTQGFDGNNRSMPNNSDRGPFSQPSRQYPNQPTNDSRSYEQQNGFHPPTTSASRGGSSNSYRPPLNMRQPIVTPRGGPNGYNGAQRAPYNQPRGGTYSAPRPTYNAPRPTYNPPRGGNTSPHPTYSAPPHASGGGGSHGGGSGHSGGHSGGHGR
jgi:FecR protein